MSESFVECKTDQGHLLLDFVVFKFFNEKNAFTI